MQLAGEDYDPPIEDDIPIPPKVCQSRLGLDQLQVGQSKFWPCHSEAKVRTLRASVHHAQGRWGHTYTTRTIVNDDGKYGVRVWRVE